MSLVREYREGIVSRQCNGMRVTYL
jgi:hypothetical protein